MKTDHSPLSAHTAKLRCQEIDVEKVELLLVLCRILALMLEEDGLRELIVDFCA